MPLVKLYGKEYHLEKEDVVNALRGVHPQPTTDFTINIDRKHYPIKQAISAATGLSTEKFSLSQAHEFLRRLGFFVENYEHRSRKHKKGRSLHF